MELQIFVILILQSRGLFINCRFSTNTFCGLHLVNANQASITDCEFDENFEKGLFLDNNSWSSVVKGGYVQGNSQISFGSYVGLRNDGQYNKFIGIHFDGTCEYGANMSKAQEKYGYYGTTPSLSFPQYTVVSECTFNSLSYTVAAVSEIGYYDSLINDLGLNPIRKIANPFPAYAVWYPNITICGFNARCTTAILPPPEGLSGYSMAWGFMASGMPLFIYVTGSSADVNVTIRDKANTVVSVLGAALLHSIYLPLEYIINFGNYTTAPTIVVSVS